jgi:nucleotide-binding universal stress UspA family protein
LYEKLAPVEVRVLHVRIPPILAGELSIREPVEGDSPEGGEDAVQSAQLLLEGAGIPYISEIRRGYVAQEIAAYAKDLNCSAIIMGTRGMGTADQMLGSIVRQVIALTTIPITLVK